MKKMIWVIMLVVFGSSGLFAVSTGERDLQWGRRLKSAPLPPVSFYASRHEARIVRSIERNHRRIDSLHRENRSLLYRLRFAHFRQKGALLRRIERNRERIYRLQRMNRMLVLKLRHR